ncbi:MAG: hypothetical protein ABI041_08070, partial [Bdellovibrionia bacterium]
MVDQPVYLPNTVSSTANAANKVQGGLPYFTQINLNNGGDKLDLSSAVLRAIIHPSEVAN